MRKKILVVEDESGILRVVSFRLSKTGYEVLKAVNGREALDAVEKNRPDLVLLDLRLPLVDGYEVCRRIKEDRELKKIPVILFTAGDIKEVEKRLDKLQAEDVVAKPFDYEVLLKKIEKWIEKESSWRRRS